MLDGWIANAAAIVQSSPWLAPLVVFAGGLLTASNPCVLAMIPLMIAFVTGDKRIDSPARAFAFSLLFVLGLVAMFTAMGVFAALVGRMFGDVSAIWNWIVAGVCLLMGLHLLGAFTLPLPQIDAHPRIQGALGAFVLGLLFGIVSAPCAAPILIVLLTTIAGSGSSAVYGGLLLAIYALGHCVLILIAGTSVGAAKKIIANRNLTRTTNLLRRAAGVLIILVGAYFGYRGL